MPNGSGRLPRATAHGLALLRAQYGDDGARAALTSPVYGARYRDHAARCTAGCREIMNELFPDGIIESDIQPDIDYAVVDRIMDDCPGSNDSE